MVRILRRRRMTTTTTRKRVGERRTRLASLRGLITPRLARMQQRRQRGERRVAVGPCAVLSLFSATPSPRSNPSSGLTVCQAPSTATLWGSAGQYQCLPKCRRAGHPALNCDALMEMDKAEVPRGVERRLWQAAFKRPASDVVGAAVVVCRPRAPRGKRRGWLGVRKLKLIPTPREQPKAVEVLLRGDEDNGR